MLGLYLNIWSSLLAVHAALFQCFASADYVSVDSDLARELRIACHRFTKAIDELEEGSQTNERV